MSGPVTPNRVGPFSDDEAREYVDRTLAAPRMSQPLTGIQDEPSEADVALGKQESK